MCPEFGSVTKSVDSNSHGKVPIKVNDDSGREFSPAQQHKSHILTVHNVWTESERLTFREKFAQHGKVFHKIAANIPTKNVCTYFSRLFEFQLKF